MKKHHLGQLMLFAAAAACAILPAGCSSREPEAPITFQTPFPRESREFAQLDEMVKLFCRENPDVEVTLLPEGSARPDFVLRGIVAGTAADVIELPLHSLQAVASQTALLELSEALEANTGRIISSELAAAEYEGRLVAAPIRASSVQLIYNCDVLRDAGYRPNDPLLGNWTELLRTCESIEYYLADDGCRPLAIAGGEGKPLAALFAMLVRQTGGWIVHADDQPAENALPWCLAVDGEAGIRALEMFARLMDYMPKDVLSWTRRDLVREFAAGRVGMCYGDTALLSEILAAEPDMEAGVVKAPVGGFFASYVTTYGAIIPARARRREACERLLAFLTGRRAQEIVMTGGQTGCPAFVSIRRDLLDSDWNTRHPRYRKFVEGLNSAAAASPNGIGQGRQWPPIAGWAEVERRVVIPELRLLARGDVTPESAAEKIRRVGDLALVTHYRSLGHVEKTEQLAMAFLAVGVFFLVLFAVGHRSKETPQDGSR